MEKWTFIKSYKKGIIYFVIFCVLYFTFSIFSHLFLESYLVNNAYELYELLEIIPYLFILIVILLLKRKIGSDNLLIKSFNTQYLLLTVVLVALFRISIDPFFRLNVIFNTNVFSVVDRFEGLDFEIKSLCLTFINVIILVPLVEESVFRDIILNAFSFKRSVNSIAASGILFTIIHLPLNIDLIAVIFLFGILTGIVAIRMGLIYSVIFHLLYNLIWMIERYLDRNWLFPHGEQPHFFYWGSIILSGIFLVKLLSKIWKEKTQTFKQV